MGDENCASFIAPRATVEHVQTGLVCATAAAVGELPLGAVQLFAQQGDHEGRPGCRWVSAHDGEVRQVGGDFGPFEGVCSASARFSTTAFSSSVTTCSR